MESFDLFQRGAEPGRPNAAAERAVDATAAYFSARVVVAMAQEHDAMLPVAVRGADRRVLDGIARTWSLRRSDLAEGRALYGVAGEVDAGRDGGAFVLAPVMEGGRLSGLLYVQSDEPRFRDPKDLDALVQFSRMLASALLGPPVTLSTLHDFLERTPSDEVSRQQLLLLLERHEWNIARVSRALGVTRTTIYKRLERYGVERVKIPKTIRRRPRLTPSPDHS
jgi:hypothetical protein